MMDPLFGIWQFFVVWALGLVLIRWIRLELPTGYRLAFAFGLGEMTVSYFLFLLGMVGGLRFSILVPLAVLITLGGFPRLIREMRHAGTAAWPYLRQSPWLSLGVAGIFGLYALSACTPEREVDSVWYHLGVPLYYITHGGSIQLVPFNMPSHYPMNLHLHYCFSLLVGNEVTAKFFILFHFLPIFLLLWAVIARYAGARWGLWGILLYCCCMHFRIPVMANVERAVYFYVFLSTALLWMALEKKSWRLLLWASVFCGMAMGTKFNGHLFGYAAQWLLLAIAIFGLRAMPVGEGMWKWIAHTL
ncbi:MAG: glycosyltransferase family 39 protein, partial [bacterium]|nr:glycosyltransferase family 39 protein [bacterium]